MIALIPARGGSKRLPRKNIRDFFGHPMIAYSIAAAKRSGLFERVVVSTDDAEIAEQARRYGAEVAARPPELATDAARLPDVAVHTLQALGVRDDDAFCQLMPNCPLRRAEDITTHWDAFERGRREFQISVVPFRVVYPAWSLTIGSDGKGSWYYDSSIAPSNRLPTLFCPTGAIWWARWRSFREQRRFYGDPFHAEPMDADRGIDIDTPDDLALADVLVRGLRDRDGSDPLEAVG